MNDELNPIGTPVEEPTPETDTPVEPTPAEEPAVEPEQE